MNCSPDDIVCALQYVASRIPDAPNPLQDIAVTLLATLVGGFLALLGSWFLNQHQMRLQADEAYKQRVDELLVTVMHAIGDRSGELAKLDSGDAPAVSYELDVRAQAAWMVARGDDVEVIKQLKYSLTRISEKSVADQLRDLRVASQIIRAWRNETDTPSNSANRFEGLSTAEART